MHDALVRLEQRLLDHGIDVDFEVSYPERVKYKFLSEELMEHTMQQFDIPGMVCHFSYEEFHPNHELSIKRLTEDFMRMWFDRRLEGSEVILNEILKDADGKEHSREAVSKSIQAVFDAYTAFDNCAYLIGSIEFNLNDEEEGTGKVKGKVQYRAILENSEELEITEAFCLRVSSNLYPYWEVSGFQMPGLKRF